MHLKMERGCPRGGEIKNGHIRYPSYGGTWCRVRGGTPYFDKHAHGALKTQPSLTFHKASQYTGDVRGLLAVDAIHHLNDAVLLHDLGETALRGQVWRKHTLHYHRGLEVKTE